MCSLVPLRKAAYVWYRTMTAILLRRERGRNNAEIYAVLVVTPPPLFSAKLRFKRGGVTTREYGICRTLPKHMHDAFTFIHHNKSTTTRSKVINIGIVK